VAAPGGLRLGEARGAGEMRVRDRCCIDCAQLRMLYHLNSEHDVVVQVALDIARGLHFLHSSGVIHRCDSPHMWSCMQWDAYDGQTTILLLFQYTGLPPGWPSTLPDGVAVYCPCRDIKTSNVLLARDGTAKIADVGLAITADYFSAGSATGTFRWRTSTAGTTCVALTVSRSGWLPRLRRQVI
jgi:hypothetical protein